MACILLLWLLLSCQLLPTITIGKRIRWLLLNQLLLSRNIPDLLLFCRCDSCSTTELCLILASASTGSNYIFGRSTSTLMATGGCTLLILLLLVIELLLLDLLWVFRINSRWSNRGRVLPLILLINYLQWLLTLKRLLLLLLGAGHLLELANLVSILEEGVQMRDDKVIFRQFVRPKLVIMSQDDLG